MSSSESHNIPVRQVLDGHSPHLTSVERGAKGLLDPSKPHSPKCWAGTQTQSSLPPSSPYPVPSSCVGSAAVGWERETTNAIVKTLLSTATYLSYCWMGQALVTDEQHSIISSSSLSYATVHKLVSFSRMPNVLATISGPSDPNRIQHLLLFLEVCYTVSILVAFLDSNDFLTHFWRSTCLFWLFL